MTVTRSAALFPGQGAYAGGVLTAVRDRAEVREILRDIDEVARRFSAGSVSELLCAADAAGIDELLRTDPDLLQLAIYGTSVAAYRLALARGMRPDVLVGHSFGEVAALVCGGAYSVAAGAEIVCHRNAALRAPGEVDGHQLALSADVAAVEQILLLIGDPEAVVAVENHAGQTVIAGPRGSLDTARAIAAALRIGATPLKSAYPFHSPMLSEAAFDFAARIRHIPWQLPGTEVYSPILGRAYRSGDDLNVALAGHLTRRVRFAEALRALRIDTVVECGALDTLGKIARNVLGDEVRIAPVLEDSGLSRAIARPTGSQRESVRLALAPGLAAGEFDRLWTACVERIAQLTISEFAAAVGPVAPDERPALVATPAPATPTYAPAASTHPPAASTYAPAASTYAPAASTYAPAASTYAPATSTHPPAASTYAPAASTYAPATSTHPPAASTYAPAASTYAPVASTHPPAASTYAPAASTYAPVASTHPPAASTYAPVASTYAPAASTYAPAVPTYAPATHAPAAPTLASAPATLESPSRKELFQQLVVLYADALEYPPEVFDEDTDLEAELGVDSVKQTELLMRIGDAYELGPLPSDFKIGELNTLGRIADLIAAA